MKDASAAVGMWWALTGSATPSVFLRSPFENWATLLAVRRRLSIVDCRARAHFQPAPFLRGNVGCVYHIAA